MALRSLFLLRLALRRIRLNDGVRINTTVLSSICLFEAVGASQIGRSVSGVAFLSSGPVLAELRFMETSQI